MGRPLWRLSRADRALGLTGYYISPLLVAPNTPRQAVEGNSMRIWVIKEPKQAHKPEVLKLRRSCVCVFWVQKGNTETTAGESEAASPKAQKR